MGAADDTAATNAAAGGPAGGAAAGTDADRGAGTGDAPTATAAIPLCIDLDGTLIRSDVLVESALALLARNPLYAFTMLWWLRRGRAYAKQQVARRVDLAVARLPYDTALMDWLRSQRGQRKLVLCTASDRRYADAVAAHVGLFDEVLASDGRTNLSGSRKAAALTARYGERQFDYAGNERADLAVWRHARRAVVVGAGNGLERAAAATCSVERSFPPATSRLRAAAKALRPHQWLKNLLVFVPLLAAHRFFDGGALTATALAVTSFCLCASGTYLLNDLLDLDADRSHPRKRRRPFASGSLPLTVGLVGAPLLTVAAFALSLAITPVFAFTLLCYFALTLSYSLQLKRIAMLDVIVLAGLYTVRIIGGAAAMAQELSFWLLAFAMFVFLSLAMLKRYAELHDLRAQGGSLASGRGYDVEDLALVQSLGAAAGYVSVLVLALYINSGASQSLYTRPAVLWLLCPLLLYWISRAWAIAHRGAMHDDPLVFAATDRVSLVTIVLAALTVVAAL
ncbi:MAG TPA: UbiA family prenyltransferase [Gammaproteobacteria bacterium]|nr:UbiA family prenyltransferase [Gammaproteobacteria bacterium]